MANKGYFNVFRDTQNTDDIHYQQIELEDDEQIPEDQLELRDEVDSTLTTLRALFTNKREKFEQYFRPLLALAQLGLVGNSANPALAKRALASLKHEVLVREGGQIKNQYMKQLGIAAIAMIVPILLLTIAIYIYSSSETVILTFFYLWIGCMVGVWLSFGTRRVEITFDELAMLEKDQLNPVMRLLFAGILTMVIGLMFRTKLMAIEFGSLSTDMISTDAEIAILVGIFCGLSEKVLSVKVAQQATDFFGNK